MVPEVRRLILAMTETEVLVHDLELSTLEADEFWSFVRRRSATSRRRNG
jgi:hypothetical protein